MYGPAKKLSRVNANLQQAIAASERIFEMLDTHTEVTERPGARAAGAVSRATIEFRDVTFGYDEARAAHPPRRVVHGARPARWSPSSGRSGAGKTTLVNLLPRFYDVTGGAILIDGVDIRDVTLASLRGQIGIVTQETVLFDDTDRRPTSPTASPKATPRRDRGGGAGRATPTSSSSALPQGYDTDDRRARPAAVGRPAPAAGDRARAAQERADPGAGRSDVGARHRVGAARAGGARAT